MDPEIEKHHEDLEILKFALKKNPNFKLFDDEEIPKERREMSKTDLQDPKNWRFEIE